MSMPFVEMFVPSQLSLERQARLAAAVHHALVRTVGVPPADRFQVIIPLSRSQSIYDASYLGIERSEGFVTVRITFRRGRTPGQKRALYRAIAELAERDAQVRPEDVLVTLVENDALDWSFGRGAAQYAPEEATP